MKFPKVIITPRSHEWIKQKGSTYLVGITDYAVKMLNDIVYVNLPERARHMKSGQDTFGQVESIKTVSDVFMPVSGKVLKANSKLTQTPELVTNAPYGEGWMLEIESNSFSQESEWVSKCKSIL